MNTMGQSLKEALLSSFENLQVENPEETRVIVTCRNDSLHAVLNYLKNSGYDHLALVSCVDRIKKNELELVYILTAYTEDKEQSKMNILVKTSISRDKPEFQTIINLFENAEPYERELHELYGIHFEGHPRLTPLLLERKYETPPFRKDFDTRKYVQQVFDEVPFVEDEAEAEAKSEEDKKLR